MSIIYTLWKRVPDNFGDNPSDDEPKLVAYTADLRVASRWSQQSTMYDRRSYGVLEEYVP